MVLLDALLSPEAHVRRFLTLLQQKILLGGKQSTKDDKNHEKSIGTKLKCNNNNTNAGIQIFQHLMKRWRICGKLSPKK